MVEIKIASVIVLKLIQPLGSRKFILRVYKVS